MSMARNMVSVVIFVLPLIGCAPARDTKATLGEERDAQNFQAKPGMARVYLIHGLAKMMEQPSATYEYTYYKRTGRHSPKWNATGAAAGAGIGVALSLLASSVTTALASDTPPPPDPFDPTDPEFLYPHVNQDVAEEHYIDERDLGRIVYGQYFAVDLPPGDHVFKAFQLWAAGRKPMQASTVELKAGEVVYLYSSVDTSSTYSYARLFRCNDECRPFVTGGQRIIEK